MLERARRAGCAVGSFAPRYTPVIAPVLRAGQRTASPLIVQISQNEFGWYEVSAAEFAAEFFAQLRQQAITAPVTLHLDHTRDFAVIEQAIAAGFTSVMIDASDKPLDENIALTRAVVEYAHARDVSVEAELGRIGKAGNENIETRPAWTRWPSRSGRCTASTRSGARRSTSTGCAPSAPRPPRRSCCMAGRASRRKTSSTRFIFRAAA